MRMRESVLFWPVKFQEQTLMILDETRLPQSVVYLKARNYRAAIQAVVDMKTRAFGQFLTVCYAFVLEVMRHRAWDKAKLMAHLEAVAVAFNKSRPTFPFEEVTGMAVGFARGVYGSHQFALDYIAAMTGFLETKIRYARYARAEAAAALIKDGASVLTHCNVSGELPLVGEFCRRQGKQVKFFATETRPYFQGARLTAWELKDQGFDVTLVPDNAVANLMAGGDVTCVVVGSDRSAKNGDFANKVGTYQIALLARHFSIPFYVLTQPSEKLASGDDIPIEIRDEEEILTYGRHRLAPAGVRAYYPGFDVVSHDWVSESIAIRQS